MRTAVCLIVRDEVDYIEEWIRHYSQIGFDAIIIYDNQSSDGTYNSIVALQEQFDIRLSSWPLGHDPQVESYNDCLSRYKIEFDWIAFLDLDEMLVHINGSFEVKEFLGQFENADAVCINWLMFGSSHLETRGNLLMMEAFRYRAPIHFPPNRNVKSIIRPQKVLSACDNPHWFHVSGRTVNANGTEIVWDVKQKGLITVEDIVHADWRLHHYYTRSREDWQKRLKRGQSGGVVVPRDAFGHHDCNQVCDETAFPYAQKIREEKRQKS